MTLIEKLMALNNAVADYGSAEIPAKLMADLNELSRKLREQFAPIVEAYNEGLLSSEDFYLKLTMEAYRQ